MNSRPASRLRQTPAEAAVSLGLIAWGVLEAFALASPTPLGVRVAFALLATLALVWRNQWPVAVLAWSAAVIVMQEAWDVMPATAVTPYQCLSLATYALAASSVRPPVVHAIGWPLAFAYPALLLLTDTDDSYGWQNGVGLMIGQLLLLLVGLIVRRRREAAAAADAELRRAGASAAASIEAAVVAERTAILQDMGAVVSAELRRVQVLLASADAALRAGQAEAARERAEAVQRTVASAVLDLRRLLNVLRADASPREFADDVTLAELDRGQARRDRIADALVAVSLAGPLVADVWRAPDGLLLPSAGTGVALLAALWWRRRRPLLVALILTGGLLGRQLVGLAPELPLTIMPTVLIATYALAAFSESRRRAVAGTLAVAAGGAGAAVLLIGEGGAWTDLPVVAFLAGCAYAVGELVRENHGRLLTLRAGARALASEHRRRRALALEQERRRVARELHDVVAHGVSLIGVQAGAAAVTAGRDPAAAARAIAVAADALEQTGDELRQLSALLGGGDAMPPGIVELHELVAAAGRAGQPVELQLHGDLGGVPEGVGVSVYRIAQEALTNARKHAAGASSLVRLSVASHSVTLEVITHGRPGQAGVPGTGRGIAGMRERARLLGGELDAGPIEEGFRVRAELPADAARETATTALEPR